MQITGIQPFQPNFKAQFSKDKETKRILTLHNNIYQVHDTYWAISALNNIATNDSISLKRVSKKNKNQQEVYRIKNERTEAFIDVASDFRHNLLNTIGCIAQNPTTPEYKKLFGKSALVRYGESDENLDELSGANKIDREITKLYLKNSDLETEIYRNTREIRKLDKQKLEARHDYVQNLID